MKKLLLILLLAGQTEAAYALDLTVPLGSYHFDRSKKWQEKNWGLGVNYKNYVAGYYKNSYDRDSIYIGYHWQPEKLEYNRHLKAGLTMIAVSGYRSSPVLLVPTVSVETTEVSADFLLAPALGKATGFVGMQLRFKIAND